MHPSPTNPPDAVPKCAEWNSARPIDGDFKYPAVGDVYMTVMAQSDNTENEIEYRTLRYVKANGGVEVRKRGSISCGEKFLFSDYEDVGKL